MLIELLVTLTIPLGLDMYLPSPEENPLTAEKIELGRQLFFDKRLSRNESVSCATCHDPERGFGDGNTVAIGIGGRQGRRNAPALINRGYGRVFFWDGRQLPFFVATRIGVLSLGHRFTVDVYGSLRTEVKQVNKETICVETLAERVPSGSDRMTHQGKLFTRGTAVSH